jgi:DNA replication and repair protein RecF
VVCLAGAIIPGMSLTKLDVHRLRNIEFAELHPGPHVNLVLGENGSGKTSLLEAVHLLSRARSFRTSLTAQVIRSGLADTVVSGSVGGVRSGRHQLGVRIGRRQRELRLDGRVLTSSGLLLKSLPVQIIHPPQMSLLDGSPRNRRQYLDWGAFHVEPDYLHDWRAFARALNQRNALLKAGVCAELECWNQELARYGTIVAEARERYLAALLPCLAETVGHFLPGRRLEVVHSWGWKPDRPLLRVLRDDVPEDVRQGFTRAGPHRADLTLTVDGASAKSYLSRGQAKLLVYAMLLAQARMAEQEDRGVCILIDDLASELDRSNRSRLLAWLGECRTQCFITAVHGEDLRGTPSANTCVFHVEHGTISAG